mgnify:CR=1 FL=1
MVRRLLQHGGGPRRSQLLGQLVVELEPARLLLESIQLRVEHRWVCRVLHVREHRLRVPVHDVAANGSHSLELSVDEVRRDAIRAEFAWSWHAVRHVGD